MACDALRLECWWLVVTDPEDVRDAASILRNLAGSGCALLSSCWLAPGPKWRYFCTGQQGRWKLAAVEWVLREEPSLSNPLEALEQAGFNGSSSKIGHRERDSQ